MMTQNRTWVVVVVLLLIAVVTLWLAITLRTVLTPFILAFILAYILNPIIDFGVERRLSRDFCIFALMFALLILVIVVSSFVVPSMVRQTISLVDRFPSWVDGFSDWVRVRETQINSFAVIRDYYPNGISLQPTNLLKLLQDQITPEQVKNALGLATNWSTGLFSGLFGVFAFLFYAGLFVVSTVYLLRDYHTIIARGRALIPHRNGSVIIGVFTDIDDHLQKFFRGQLLVCIINSVILSVFLMIAQAPYALLFGFLVGFLNIIPYLGVSIGFVLAAIVSFIIHEGDVWYPGYVVIAFVIQQMIDGSMITPRLLGDKVGLHPVVIIASFLIFGSLFGFFGVLLAVPMATVVKVLVAHVIAYYKNSDLFGEPPPQESLVVPESAPAAEGND